MPAVLGRVDFPEVAQDVDLGRLPRLPAVPVAATTDFQRLAGCVEPVGLRQQRPLGQPHDPIECRPRAGRGLDPFPPQSVAVNRGNARPPCTRLRLFLDPPAGPADRDHFGIRVQADGLDAFRL